MSTFAERRTIAQEIAKTQVAQNVAALASPSRAIHGGTLFGLTFAAITLGMTHVQVLAIQDTASDWAADHCPAIGDGPLACAGATCSHACQYIPIKPRHWR